MLWKGEVWKVQGCWRQSQSRSLGPRERKAMGKKRGGEEGTGSFLPGEPWSTKIREK